MQTIEDAQTVCRIAGEQDFMLQVSSGAAIIDARSLMGLFTLLGRKSNLIAPDGVDYDCFIKAIKRMRFS